MKAVLLHMQMKYAPSIRKKSGSWLSSGVLLLMGVCLFYFAVRNQDWYRFISILRSGNYTLVPFIACISFCSYLFRNERWRLLATAASYQVRRRDALAALSVSYLINYAIPRLGELTRCYLIKRKSRIPFAYTLGTVIAERLTDILMLMLVVAASFLLQYHVVTGFASDQVMKPLLEWFLERPWYTWLIGLLTCTALLYALIQRTKHKIAALLDFSMFTQGLKSISKLKHLKWFVCYTLGIWTCYFLMTYLWAFTFEATQDITFLQAFVVMSAGTLGRSLPIQGGGFGAYHVMVTQVLLLYGISESYGFALAVIIHGGQMIFSLLMGVWGYVYVSLHKKL